MQRQCPAGRCEWSLADEACEPATGYGLADLRSQGMSALEAYEAGYTPQDIRDAGYTLDEISDAVANCITCQKAATRATRHAAAARRLSANRSSSSSAFPSPSPSPSPSASSSRPALNHWQRHHLQHSTGLAAAEQMATATTTALHQAASPPSLTVTQATAQPRPYP